MLIIFISYEFAGVYEPNLKMQEVALCNIAATDTQKWVDTVTCWLFESRTHCEYHRLSSGAYWKR